MKMLTLKNLDLLWCRLGRCFNLNGGGGGAPDYGGGGGGGGVR